MTAQQPALAPFFLQGAAGPVFALHVGPGPAEAKGALLYLPPFAEEMNRSRYMAARLARALAERKVATLLLDPSGTGDSVGEFSQASWGLWREDAARALAWLTEQGYSRVHLLGLRSGANLALAAVEGLVQPGGPQGVVMWQPVLKGQLFLNQFLRIRVAASLGADDGRAKESGAALRARIKAGETLEVAGYPLSAEMARELGQIDLDRQGQGCPCPLHWIDVVGDAESGPGPAAQAVRRSIEAPGKDLSYRRVVGEPFWSIEEPVLVSALIEETLGVICGARR